MEKIIEWWLKSKISKIDDTVKGINGIAEIYDFIENKLNIPHPYSTVVVLIVAIIISIGIFFLIRIVFFDDRLGIAHKPPKD